MHLYEFYESLRDLQLPESVLHVAKMRILDTLAIAAKGSTLQMGKTAVQSAKQLGGSQGSLGSRILFDGTTVSCADAALAG